MALIAKIMSGEDLPDDDSRKSFRLFDNIGYFAFVRDEQGFSAGVYLGLNDRPDDAAELGPQFYPIEGNVYIMNQAGKTVASFGVSTAEAVARATSKQRAIGNEPVPQKAETKELSDLERYHKTWPNEPYVSTDVIKVSHNEHFYSLPRAKYAATLGADLRRLFDVPDHYDFAEVLGPLQYREINRDTVLSLTDTSRFLSTPPR